MKYIVLSTDNGYVQHCAATLTSISQNNPNTFFYILTEGLEDKNADLLLTLAHNNKCELEVLTVSKEFIDKVPMPDEKALSHISPATYYRLLISSLLPDSVDKVVYMDCDIIVRKSLEQLFEIDVANYALGAVFQDDPTLLQGDEQSRLGLSAEQGYFNAGVLLMNLAYWRENKVEEQLLDFMDKNYNNIRFHDQDVLNAVLGKKTRLISCNWNLLTVFLTRALHNFTSERCVNYRKEVQGGIGNDPAVVHFVYRPKPWEWSCVHPFKSEYYKYLDKTPFKGWRPRATMDYASIRERVINLWPFNRLSFLNPKAIFVKY